MVVPFNSIEKDGQSEFTGGVKISKCFQFFSDFHYFFYKPLNMEEKYMKRGDNTIRCVYRPSL